MGRAPKYGSRRCRIFNCNRRHGSFCCVGCGYKRSGSCKNPCLNDPERCRQVLPKGALCFLKRVKRTRLIATGVTLVLTLWCIWWLYDAEFHYPNTSIKESEKTGCS